MKKKCSNCKIIFDCRGDDILNCHCTKVVLTDEQLALVKEKYADCLCAKCLLELND